MKLTRHREPAPLPPTGSVLPSVVAVGNFDGVHRGHQRGLARARAEARRHGLIFRVVTFDPHPARLLRPDQEPAGITPLPLKAEYLGQAGVDALVVVEFTHRFAAVSPEHFVDRLLVGRLGARVVVQGANFRFGRERSGDLTLLRRLGAERGIQVVETTDAEFEGRIISSTRIREALAAARLDAARGMLGRPYEIRGRVVPGAGRGHRLGFATANLVPEGDVLIPDGVYAAEARAATPEGTVSVPAVVHKGRRPTFGDEATLETHLIGFAGTVEDVRIRLATFLREIRSFPDPGTLARQIGRDVAAARELLPIAQPALASS